MCHVPVDSSNLSNSPRKLTDIRRRFPNPSRGTRACSGSHGLMRDSYITLSVIFVTLSTMTPSCIAQIQGSIAKCHLEGEQVFIPGISTNPCISCVCKMREVTCSQRECPPNDGCHMILFDKPRDQCCETCKGCVYQGKSHPSGSQWSEKSDPCKIYTCQAGVLTTSIQRCHVTCKSPRLVPGQCCPVCAGCSMRGVEYREGQHFPSPADPCSTCTCQNGSTWCGRQVCPVLNCALADQYKSLGSCCPSCMGTRQIYPPPRGRCLYQRRVHDNNTDVTPDKCTSCTCKEGTLKCDRKTCPILDCATRDVMHHAGTCCPVCKHTKRRCKFSGKKYPHSAVWLMDVCTHCLCDDGTARCQAETCSNLLECPNNTRLKMIPGQCCPQCVDDGALCTVFGDPHYRSFDGHIFNFQGTCDYILTQSRDNTITVIVRNEARMNDLYAWTKSVRIQVGGAKIYFLQKNRVKVNKKRVLLPYVHRGSRFSVVSIGRSVALKTPSGIKVTWDGDSYLEVFVPPHMKGNLQGLCGNYNNDASDDFIGQDGAMYVDADEFSNTWLTGRKRCHGDNVSPAAGHVSPCADDPARQQRAERSCKTLYTPGLLQCHIRHDVEPYYTSCVTDMCECPADSHCFCEALLAYTHACAQGGSEVEHYLPNVCRAAARCPRGAFWVQCASTCPRTCENPRGVNCAKSCKPGCQCPDGTLLHNNKCVRPSRCQHQTAPKADGKAKDNSIKKNGKRRRKMREFASPLDFLIENK